MGINESALKVLLEENARRRFAGSVLSLGKQDIYFTKNDLFKIAKQFEISLSFPPNIEYTNKQHAINKKYISDKYLFSSIGFSQVTSIDVSDYEKADIVFDLNNNDLPLHLYNAFDVIIDGGTLEHVFHLPNALQNVYKMLKIGGRIIHLSPSSNHIDHGFYMFCPTLFFDYYKINNFEMNKIQMFKYSPFHRVDKWQMSNYEPGCLDKVGFGGLDDGMYGIVCVATKNENSTSEVIPQQHAYRVGMWKTVSNPSRNRVKQIMHSSNPVLVFIRECTFLRKFLWRLYKFGSLLQSMIV